MGDVSPQRVEPDTEPAAAEMEEDKDKVCEGSWIQLYAAAVYHHFLFLTFVNVKQKSN